MEPNKRKLLSGPESLRSDYVVSQNGSHTVTLPQSEEQPFVQSIRGSDSNFTDHHLTARITNSQIGRREMSLILDVLNYQIVRFGCNFNMMLALTELSMRLTGGLDPDLVSDPYIRKTVTVSQILVKTLGKEEFSLDSREYVYVNSSVKELLEPYLMTKRTYKSRFTTYRPERLIMIKAVPVSDLYERISPSHTERYSGYTKGYGESHGNAHRQSTKPSAELDGDLKRPDKVQRNLYLRIVDPLHQIVNSLRIKFENLTEENL